MQRDLFLSYNSVDREAVARLRLALSSQGISTFYDRADLTPGQPWFDELEAALHCVRASAVFIGKAGLGSIQKREMQFLLVRQADEERQGRRFPVIPVLLEGADPETTCGFLALNTWVDLRRGLDDPQAVRSFVEVLHHRQSQPQESFSYMCPYRGLNAFREEDSPLFFGRQDSSQKLFDQILKQSLVTVVGRSGSGKSSIAQAGLLPLLRRQKPPADTWESVIFSPGSKPFHRLAMQLVPLWSPPGRDQTDISTESQKLGDRLASGEVNLATFTTLALSHLSNTSRLVVLIDQFEELFTQTPQEDQRKRFVRQLLEAIAESKLTLVLVLRADFYGHTIGLDSQLAERIANGLINVVDMTRHELQHAVEEPALRSGLRFEAGLVDRILDHVERQPGSLPLLEYALTELWQRRQENLLTHASYDAIGGVGGAITKRADQQFDKLSPLQKQLAMPALCRLVSVASPTTAVTGARQLVRFSEFDSEAREVMRIFAAREARLVVLGRDEMTGEETVQVAHEALIRGWNKLKSSIETDRDFLCWRQQLRPFLDKWRSLPEHKETALLQGVYLTEADRWLRERPNDLSEEERRFIQASERPTIRSKRTKRLSVAMVILALLGVLWAADGGLNFPGSKALRRWIDDLNVSVMRHPKSYAQLQSITDRLTLGEIEALRRYTTPEGWINVDKVTDYYSHAQATCALLHNSSRLEGKPLPEAALQQLFDSAPREERAGNSYGWKSDAASKDMLVQPMLWAGSALAALASRGMVSREPWSIAFQQNLQYIQQSLITYYDNGPSGWRQFPNAEAPSAYATVLATQMLMDLRDAQVPWQGKESLDSLIQDNIQWLLKNYHPDQNSVLGWQEGSSQITVSGLTLQAYAVLLRAMSHGDALKAIKAAKIDETITHLLEDGFDEGEQWHDQPTWPSTGFINPKTGEKQYSSHATIFLWYPWAIECVARWMEANSGNGAALHRHLIRRTLTQLLVRGDRSQKAYGTEAVFRHAELLYSLGSLQRALALVKEK